MGDPNSKPNIHVTRAVFEQALADHLVALKQNYDSAGNLKGPLSTSQIAQNFTAEYGNTVDELLRVLAHQSAKVFSNVIGQGATLDGSTSDESALQASIDEMDTAGGGLVLVPPGTPTHGALTRPSGVRMVHVCVGDPNGVRDGVEGDWAYRVDGSDALYRKEGTGNTGWVAVIGGSVSGGGGWTEVWARDLRQDADADLNTAGSSVVIDGVTWRTPAAAVTGSNMVAADTGFDILNGTGLVVENANNARANPGTLTGNFLYASLYDLAQNSSTPFDPDPTREYLWQAYVSSSNNDGTNTELSGVIMFRPGSLDSASNGLPGDDALYRCLYGTLAGAGGDLLEGTGGTSGSPTRNVYRNADLTAPAASAPDVPMIHYKGPQSFQFGGGVWSSGWPDQSDLSFFNTARDPTDIENDIVLHPRYGFFLGFGHVAENTNQDYNATIQQVRLLQK